MRGEYNLTTAGLRNAEQYGIGAAEIFEVIDSGVRLFSRVGERSMLVLGPTIAGRLLVVLVTEADLEPDVWDVVAAREMHESEITAYRRVRGGGGDA